MQTCQYQRYCHVVPVYEVNILVAPEIEGVEEGVEVDFEDILALQLCEWINDGAWWCSSGGDPICNGSWLVGGDIREADVTVLVHRLAVGHGHAHGRDLVDCARRVLSIPRTKLYGQQLIASSASIEGRDGNRPGVGHLTLR